ncbi:hypothetical protein PXNS11_330009 [Stutzerimonas xanthomarina]|nr:hypothetical protein PXNS11_330009 [Stutzerimonas xanthomarina]
MGDGCADWHRLLARPHRRGDPFLPGVVLRVTRIHDTDADAQQRLSGLGRGVLPGAAATVSAGSGRLVRPVCHLHSGLRVPVAADPGVAGWRHHAFSRTCLEGAMGPDDRSLLRLPRPCPAHPGNCRLRRSQPAADRLADHRRAALRRVAVRLRQVGRQAQDRPAPVAVQDCRRLRRRDLPRDTDRRGAVLDHPVRLVAGGADGAAAEPAGLLRRAGDVSYQTRPWRQGLGAHDRGPRRHARPARFGLLRRADLLPPGALRLDLTSLALALPGEPPIAPRVEPATALGAICLSPTERIAHRRCATALRWRHAAAVSVHQLRDGVAIEFRNHQ